MATPLQKSARTRNWNKRKLMGARGIIMNQVAHAHTGNSTKEERVLMFKAIEELDVVLRLWDANTALLQEALAQELEELPND